MKTGGALSSMTVKSATKEQARRVVHHSDISICEGAMHPAGASPEGSEQSGSAGPRVRTGQRNPSRASSGRSGRTRSATPAQERAASAELSADEEAGPGKPAGKAQTCKNWQEGPILTPCSG